MTGLQHLVLEFRAGELVVRCLYRTEGKASPNTKARRRKVTALTKAGLQAALKGLEGGVEVVGTSGFTTREDILSLPHSCETREAAS